MGINRKYDLPNAKQHHASSVISRPRLRGRLYKYRSKGPVVIGQQIVKRNPAKSFSI